MESGNFKEPTKITVDLNSKFPNIVGYIFEEQQPIEEIKEVENEVEVTDEDLERLMW